MLVVGRVPGWHMATIFVLHFECSKGQCLEFFSYEQNLPINSGVIKLFLYGEFDPGSG